MARSSGIESVVWFAIGGCEWVCFVIYFSPF
jgi:hypothetical protein